MDPDSETYTKTTNNQNNQTKPGNMAHDVSAVFQPFRFRRSPILASREDWKFITSEFRFVLYCGIVLWTLYAFSRIV